MRIHVALALVCTALIGLCAVSEAQIRENRKPTPAQSSTAPQSAPKIALPPSSRPAAPAPAPSARPLDRGPYALDLLHGDVRATIEEVRRASPSVERARSQASIAAASSSIFLTSANAETARWGANTANFRTETKNGLRNGAGQQTIIAGPNIGDSFSGNWSGGEYANGEYKFARNAANTQGYSRYLGQFKGNRREGLGTLEWSNGDYYVGGFVGDFVFGLGVKSYRDGRRIEGEWADGQPDGLAVEWSAEGTVRRQGVWKDGTLIEPLRPQP